MFDSTNPLSTIQQEVAAVCTAKVESINGNVALIDSEGSISQAQLAFSCLVRPQPQDIVMCTKTESGIFYILGIIERPGIQKMTIAFPADVTMVAEDGNVGLMSRKSITLAAEKGLNCLSEKAVHKSREAVVDFDECVARGTTFQATFKTVNLISQVITTMARQCIERMKNYIRHTQDYDQVQAGHMSRKADGLYALDSKNTILVSKKDTKIDGERIHMG